jgi:hypothetical protein
LPIYIEIIRIKILIKSETNSIKIISNTTNTQVKFVKLLKSKDLNIFALVEVKFKKLNYIYMQRKRSISQKPNSLTKKKTLPQKKKQLCTVCTITSGLTMLMQNALYRKYSFKHFS